MGWRVGVVMAVVTDLQRFKQWWSGMVRVGRRPDVCGRGEGSGGWGGVTDWLVLFFIFYV